MPNARRTTNANGYARDLLKLPQSTARNLSCQAGAVIPNSPPKHFTLSVRPDGREVFLPPLDPGRVYQVTVHGTCVYWEHWFIFVRPKTHDALYEADERPLRDSWEFRASLQEDRAAHKYTFRISGTASRISARLSPPGVTQWSFWAEGALTIFVEPLPEAAPSPVYDLVREERLFKEMRAAEEKAGRDKKAAEERTAVESKLAALRCRAHREEHFINPSFQQNYARHHLQEISSKLKGEWASEYDDLMQQPGFKQLAAKQAPEVLAWLEARVNIVRLAEQLLISPPVLQGPKKRKLNSEGVRALILRRDEIQAVDRISRKKLKAKMLVKGRAELESIPLDPDVKESLNTELDEEIRDIGEDNGKGGTTL